MQIILKAISFEKLTEILFTLSQVPCLLSKKAMDDVEATLPRSRYNNSKLWSFNFIKIVGTSVTGRYRIIVVIFQEGLKEGGGGWESKSHFSAHCFCPEDPEGKGGDKSNFYHKSHSQCHKSQCTLKVVKMKTINQISLFFCSNGSKILKWNTIEALLVTTLVSDQL